MCGDESSQPPPFPANSTPSSRGRLKFSWDTSKEKEGKLSENAGLTFFSGAELCLQNLIVNSSWPIPPAVEKLLENLLAGGSGGGWTRAGPRTANRPKSSWRGLGVQ
eukprot:EG_transcript_41096